MSIILILWDRCGNIENTKELNISLEHFKPVTKIIRECLPCYFCTDPRDVPVYLHRHLCANLHVVIYLFHKKPKQYYTCVLLFYQNSQIRFIQWPFLTKRIPRVWTKAIDNKTIL